VETGIDWIDLEVLLENRSAVDLYARWINTVARGQTCSGSRVAAMT
jgi:hypothetical protein